MTVFFLTCRRYISIFQLIRECSVFDVLIVTFCQNKCHNVGVPLENFFWHVTFPYCFFTACIIDFPLNVLNIKIFKRKYFWVFKRTYSQNTWMVFYFLIAFSTGSDSFITLVSKLPSFSIFNSLTTLQKKFIKSMSNI